MHRFLVMWAMCLALWAPNALAQDGGVIQRTEIPTPPPAPRTSWPIMDSVNVPAGADILFVSGKVPQMVNPQGPRDAIETYGDTFSQADNVLKQIAASLERAGYTKNDVVQMNVYLVPDPKTGRIDFAGFSRAYDQHFGTRETPARPARSTIGIAQLINPGWLVEIDVIAAKMDGQLALPRAAAVPTGFYAVLAEDDPGGVLIAQKGGGRNEPDLTIAAEPFLGIEGIARAIARMDRRIGAPVIDVSLSPEATATFADYTRQNVMRRIAFVFNSEVLTAPIIVEPIVQGKVQIAGGFTMAEAERIAAQLQSSTR